MMRPVVAEVRRLLKPSGSAVFVLQPNSERVGRMRPWLFEFQAWICREWNMVQDVWWWNHTALPLTKNDPSFLRGSVKACVWVGEPDCFRNVAAVRWSEANASRAMREQGRCTDKLQVRACGASVRDVRTRTACLRNGGVTPFNLIPVGVDGKNGNHSHAARTPIALCEWWTRYITPDGGRVLDPFSGTATVGVACKRLRREYVGIERVEAYHLAALERCHGSSEPLPLFGAEEADLFAEHPA